MGFPSTRTAGIAAVSLTLGTAAAASLHAPEWVWIATAVIAGVCMAAAVTLYVLVDRRGAVASGVASTTGGGGYRPLPDVLAAWLGERSRDMRMLTARLREGVAPGSRFDWRRLTAIIESFEHVSAEVLKRLQIDAPEWVGYYMQNPDWYRGGGVVPVKPEDFELRARLMDYAADQVEHIRGRLR
jgi:hypothetical protein